MKRTLVALLVCASLFPLAGPPAAATPSSVRYAAADPRAAVPGVARGPQRPGQGDTPARAPRCATPTGPFQRQAERYLGRDVDGRQSAGDCRAIRRFQRAHRIAPATGYAGRATGAAVRLMRARKDPNRAGRCPDRPERTVCADLNRQLLWVQQGGAVIFDPVTIRSGQPTMETRTGTYRIYRRSRNHTSNLYHTPMPFAQFFDRGEALHGVYEDIYAGPGSHGCINLTWSDARKLWDLLKKGDVVHVWGRKPVG
ncbi:L,D-transpeptidase family protein [Streptomyces lydicus]